MKTWIVNAALGGIALSLALGSPATADDGPKTRGLVERLPDAPDRIGKWLIDGHVVVVDAGSRIEERAAPDGLASGYWTQAATGIVVRAPAWPAPSAYAAGFRPALASEARGVGLGRVVKAKVEPGPMGDWRAVEIELADKPAHHAAR